MRLAKSFAFSDRYSLELRGEAFNIANHPNVTSVNTTAYLFSNGGSGSPLTGTATYQAPTFGAATSINSSGFALTPREIQLSARFAF
jgi:hypothetical protein